MSGPVREMSGLVLIVSAFVLISSEMPVAGSAAAELEVFPSTLRRNHFQGESLHVTVSVKRAPPGELRVLLEGKGEPLSLASQAVAGDGSYHFAVDTTYLRAGDYSLGATLGTLRARPAPVRIVSRERATNLPILFMIGEQDLMAELGHNTVLNVFDPPEARKRGEYAGRKGFELTNGERLIDEAMGLGLDFIQQNVTTWGLAHNPVRRGGCASDPAILEFAGQEVRLHAQYCRRYPSCRGLAAGDEMALPWTPNRSGNLDTVGSCRFCREAFERETGHPAPVREEWDKDVSSWVSWLRWRTESWKSFMTSTGDRMREIAPDRLWIVDTYSPFSLGDGLYPRNAEVSDILFTHHYSQWQDTGAQGIVAQGIELLCAGSAWGKSFWPIVSGWDYQDIEPLLHRHALNLALSRKVDGIGTWGPLGGEEGERVVREELEGIIRRGDFFMSLERVRGDVAVLYSVTEAALRLGGVFADVRERKRNLHGYRFPVLEAFLTSYRAHYGTDMILEEGILGGDLAHYEILLVPDAAGLPEGVIAAIEAFARSGGTVYIEKRSSMSIAGAHRLELDFTTWLEARRRFLESGPLALADEKVLEAGIDGQSRDLDRILGKRIRKLVDTPRARVALSEQRSGKARYIFAVNSEMGSGREVTITGWGRSLGTQNSRHDRRGKEERRYFTQPIVPVETELVFSREIDDYVVYDLQAGREITLDERVLPLSLEAGGMRVLCLLPSRITSIEIEAPERAEAGGTIDLSVQVSDGSGTIEAAIPLEVTVTDPEGSSRTLYRSAVNGLFEHRLVIPINVDPGAWTISIKELLSMKEASVSVLALRGGRIRSELLPDVQVFDEGAIRDLLRGDRPLWIVTGSKAPDGIDAMADGLVTSLGRAGVRSDHVKAESIRAFDTLPAYLDASVIFHDPETGKHYERSAGGPVIDPDTGLPIIDPLYGTPLERGLHCLSQTAPSWVDIPRDLILIGDRRTNPLVDDIEAAGILPRILGEGFPGPGKALIEYAWSPFEPGHDVVLLLSGAGDEAGLRKAIDRLLGMIHE